MSSQETKVYVGDLGSNPSQTELEDSFSYYGPIRNVWIARNPPGFAFVEFEDPRDASDAVRGLDGRTVCNRRVSVELKHGRGGVRRSGGLSSGSSGRSGRDAGAVSSSRNRDRSDRRDPWGANDKCYDCGEYGHYSYDCRNQKRAIKSSRSRSRSRSRGRRDRSRSRDRRRSRSPVKRSRSPRRDRDRSRSRSPRRDRDRSADRKKSRSPVKRSPSRSRSRSRGRDRTRSRSPKRDSSRR